MDAPPADRVRFSRFSPAWLAGAALFVCYAPFLRGMAAQWWNDEDMGHGFAVLPAVLWVVWRERERWMARAAAPSNWGFAILAAGAAFHCVGAIGAGLFAGSVGLLTSAAGVVVALGGFDLLRVWAFPFLLSLFMLPKLAIVYTQATLPLQLLASRLAAAGLSAAGVGVLRDANIVVVHNHAIAVEEACSGIRYLLPLAFVSLFFGYMARARTWARAVLLAAAIALAIPANALRVALAAVHPALDAGAPHLIAGWLVFVLCLGALAALHWLLEKLSGGAHA
jgi:exosortase